MLLSVGTEMKSVLYSTVAVHRHAQEMARSIHEVGCLRLWHTGWIHAPGRSWLGSAWEAAAAVVPPMRKVVARRTLVDFGKVPLQMRWKTEMVRIAAENFPGTRRLGHRIWEWHEHQLAREAANLLRRGKFTRYLGIEHGALEALRECKRLGLQSCLVFTSPHHSFWEKWAKIGDPRFRPGSHLGSNGERWMRRCYDRVDEEMELADLIRTNSELVKSSLIEAGVNPAKIVSVPLGADVAGMKPPVPWQTGRNLRFIVSGQVSPRKGSLLLLQAWKELNPAEAELHFYGGVHLPAEKLAGLPKSVVFHGNVGPKEMGEAYAQSQVLVFPTLCDGFGMVVPEAMVQGCAVLTTRNAGAADWIGEGVNGWVVEAGSVHALKDGLERVFSSRNRLEEMRAEAQETARSHTWDDFRVRLRAALTEHGFLN